MSVPSEHLPPPEGNERDRAGADFIVIPKVINNVAAASPDEGRCRFRKRNLRKHYRPHVITLAGQVQARFLQLTVARRHITALWKSTAMSLGLRLS